MEERKCAECGSTKGLHSHHIVFKSHAGYLEKCKLIQADLCQYHHQDQREGIHHNYEMDLRYKQELQIKLRTLFTKSHYKQEEIKEMLKIGNNAVRKLVKLIHWTKEGYERDSIILRIMGDENYL